MLNWLVRLFVCNYNVTSLWDCYFWNENMNFTLSCFQPLWCLLCYEMEYLYLFELFILRKIYYLIVWLEYSGALGKSVGIKKYFGMFTPAAIITKLYTRKWRKSLQKPTWLLFHFTTIHVTYKTKTRLRPRRAITALSPRVWALAWWPREINFQWNVYYIIATLCGGTRKMVYVYAR